MVQPRQAVDDSKECSVVERVVSCVGAVFVHGAEAKPENQDNGRVEDAAGKNMCEEVECQVRVPWFRLELGLLL